MQSCLTFFSLQINGILHINASSWRGVLDTTLCEKVCQVLVTGHQCFSPGTLVVSTNKTDCHDKTEILLKVVINTITLTPTRPTGSMKKYLVHIH